MAALAVALLAGCTSAMTGAGTVPGSASVRPPCSSDPAGTSSSSPAAPGCTPGPAPGPAARWAPYARSVFSTELGDPGVLNVCAIALGATLPSGLTFVRPETTRAATCRLALSPYAGPVLVTVLRDVSVVFPRGATRTSVLGETVLTGPFDGTDCQRVLLVPQSDVTTSVRVQVLGPNSDATVACGITGAVVRRFAAVAAGTVAVPVVPTAAPSLLRLDACKVATSARLAGLSVVADLGPPTPTAYDTACTYTRSAGAGTTELGIATGLLRSSADTPAGAVVTVAGHRFHDTSDAGRTCDYTSEQAEGETVEAYYHPVGDPPSDGDCEQIGSALGRYLDVLGLS